MKVALEKTPLARAIAAASSVVAARTTLPVLSCFLLRFDKKNFLLRATDLDLWVDVSATHGGADGECAVAIPAKTFGDVVRALPAEACHLDVGGDADVTLASGSAVFKVRGMAPSDFPARPEPGKEGVAFSLPQAELRAMLHRTAFAVSRDESRYFLQGVLFRVDGKNLTLVATDGRRLSKVARKLPLKGADASAIVPSKTVAILEKVLGDEGEVEISLEGRQASFSVDGISILSRLIEGAFPNYEQVIPKSNQRVVRADRRELAESLTRVALMTSDKTAAVRVKLAAGRLELSAASAEGEAREELPVTYEGEDLTVAFNPGFVVDFLRATDAAEVEIKLNDPLSPGLMEPVTEGAAQMEHLYVVMPIKI